MATRRLMSLENNTQAAILGRLAAESALNERPPISHSPWKVQELELLLSWLETDQNYQEFCMPSTQGRTKVEVGEAISDFFEESKFYRSEHQICRKIAYIQGQYKKAMIFLETSKECQQIPGPHPTAKLKRVKIREQVLQICPSWYRIRPLQMGVDKLTGVLSMNDTSGEASIVGGEQEEDDEEGEETKSYVNNEESLDTTAVGAVEEDDQTTEKANEITNQQAKIKHVAPVEDEDGTEDEALVDQRCRNVPRRTTAAQRKGKEPLRNQSLTSAVERDEDAEVNTTINSTSRMELQLTPSPAPDDFEGPIWQKDTNNHMTRNGHLSEDDEVDELEDSEYIAPLQSPRPPQGAPIISDQEILHRQAKEVYAKAIAKAEAAAINAGLTTMTSPLNNVIDVDVITMEAQHQPRQPPELQQSQQQEDPPQQQQQQQQQDSPQQQQQQQQPSSPMKERPKPKRRQRSPDRPPRKYVRRNTQPTVISRIPKPLPDPRTVPQRGRPTTTASLFAAVKATTSLEAQNYANSVTRQLAVPSGRPVPLPPLLPTHSTTVSATDLGRSTTSSATVATVLSNGTGTSGSLILVASSSSVASSSTGTIEGRGRASETIISTTNSDTRSRNVGNHHNTRSAKRNTDNNNNNNNNNSSKSNSTINSTPPVIDLVFNEDDHFDVTTTTPTTPFLNHCSSPTQNSSSQHVMVASATTPAVTFSSSSTIPSFNISSRHAILDHTIMTSSVSPTIVSSSSSSTLAPALNTTTATTATTTTVVSPLSTTSKTTTMTLPVISGTTAAAGAAAGAATGIGGGEKRGRSGSAGSLDLEHQKRQQQADHRRYQANMEMEGGRGVGGVGRFSDTILPSPAISTSTPNSATTSFPIGRGLGVMIGVGGGDNLHYQQQQQLQHQQQRHHNPNNTSVVQQSSGSQKQPPPPPSALLQPRPLDDTYHQQILNNWREQERQVIAKQIEYSELVYQDMERWQQWIKKDRQVWLTKMTADREEFVKRIKNEQKDRLAMEKDEYQWRAEVEAKFHSQQQQQQQQQRRQQHQQQYSNFSNGNHDGGGGMVGINNADRRRDQALVFSTSPPRVGLGVGTMALKSGHGQTHHGQGNSNNHSTNKCSHVPNTIQSNQSGHGIHSHSVGNPINNGNSGNGPNGITPPLPAHSPPSSMVWSSSSSMMDTPQMVRLRLEEQERVHKREMELLEQQMKARNQERQHEMMLKEMEQKHKNETREKERRHEILRLTLQLKSRGIEVQVNDEEFC